VPPRGVSLKAALGIKVEDRLKLEAFGIRSVQALAAASSEQVAAALGEGTRARAESLVSRARGLLIDE